MTEYTPTTEEVRSLYESGAWLMTDRAPNKFDQKRYEGMFPGEFDRWLNEIRAEAWDRAWREIRAIPRWWNPDDQYGEFDLQPLGPEETSEQGAFMAVREVMLDNPYRKG